MRNWLKAWKRTEKTVGHGIDPTIVVEWKNTEIQMEILEFQGIYQTTVAGTVVATDDPVASALHQALEKVHFNEAENTLRGIPGDPERLSMLSLLYPDLTIGELEGIDTRLLEGIAR